MKSLQILLVMISFVLFTEYAYSLEKQELIKIQLNENNIIYKTRYWNLDNDSLHFSYLNANKKAVHTKVSKAEISSFEIKTGDQALPTFVLIYLPSVAFISVYSYHYFENNNGLADFRNGLLLGLIPGLIGGMIGANSVSWKEIDLKTSSGDMSINLIPHYNPNINNYRLAINISF